MNKKRVIIRNGSLRMGGLERVLIEVLQTIDKEKFEIYLVIDDDCGSENIFEKDIPKEIPYFFLKPKELLAKAEYHRERKKNLYHKLMYNLTMSQENRAMEKNMQKILKELGKVDLIIDYDGGASKYMEKLDVPKKLIWIHNSISGLRKKKDKIERFGERLKKYDSVVAICDEMKEEAEQLFPFLKGKVEMIYNPFNFERIDRLAEDRSDLTPEQEKMIKEKYCIAVSRLDTLQKDYDTLLKSFKILKEKGIQEKLYIIGDGPSKEEIENLIEKYGLGDRVFLIGRTKNPYVWMKNSQLFIHSSKYEGFGLVLVEAGRTGRAVISSRCPVGPKDILEDGKSGILFEVGDYEKLAKNIEYLLTDEEARKNYESKMQKRAERFDSKRVIKEYEALLERV